MVGSVEKPGTLARIPCKYSALLVPSRHLSGSVGAGGVGAGAVGVEPEGMGATVGAGAVGVVGAGAAGMEGVVGGIGDGMDMELSKDIE